MFLGINTVDYGPTPSTNFWTGIAPPENGYTLYINKASGGPSITVLANDLELRVVTARLSGLTHSTAASAISWINDQTGMILLNREPENIVTDDLALYIDAGLVTSYPKTGSGFNDLRGNSNLTGELDITYSTEVGGSAIFVDGSSYCNFSVAIGAGTVCTVEIWANLTNPGAVERWLFGWGKFGVAISNNGNFGFCTSSFDETDIRGISASEVSDLSLYGTWHHYIFKIDISSTDIRDNTMYIDGTEITLSQQSGNAQPFNLNFNSGNGRIAGNMASSGNHLGMKMGSFKVYLSALSNIQISNNYEAFLLRAKDVTPTPKPDWSAISYVDYNVLAYTVTVKQVKGINQSIVLEVSWTGTAIIYVGQYSTQPALIDGNAYDVSTIISSGLSMINNGDSFESFNSAWIVFACEIDGSPQSGTITVTNASDGGDVIDTFVYSTE